MITTRRGFLAALIAAPVLARMAPAAPRAATTLTANVWTVGPPLTEERCLRAWVLPHVVAEDNREVIRVVRVSRGIMHVERGLRANVRYTVYPSGGYIRTSKPESMFAWGPPR